jgi:hypothetical protein
MAAEVGPRNIATTSRIDLNPEVENLRLRVEPEWNRLASLPVRPDFPVRPRRGWKGVYCIFPKEFEALKNYFSRSEDPTFPSPG